MKIAFCLLIGVTHCHQSNADSRESRGGIPNHCGTCCVWGEAWVEAVNALWGFGLFNFELDRVFSLHFLCICTCRFRKVAIWSITSSCMVWYLPPTSKEVHAICWKQKWENCHKSSPWAIQLLWLRFPHWYSRGVITTEARYHMGLSFSQNCNYGQRGKGATYPPTSTFWVREGKR